MDCDRFIAEIKARPGIWQISNPEHKNKLKTKKLWDEIQKKFPEFKGDFQLYITFILFVNSITQWQQVTGKAAGTASLALSLLVLYPDGWTALYKFG